MSSSISTPDMTAPATLATRPPDGSPPTISIIVPVLNEEKLLEASLSCFSRDLRRECGAELIVSDGGSTDGSLEIARRHADIVIEHTEQRRQTIAEGRNRGAAAASGRLLVFINGDTVPPEPATFLRALSAVADSMPTGGRVAAIACPVAIAPDERRLSDRIFHSAFNRYVRLLNLLGVGMGRGECQVVRRDLFELVGGYHDHMAAGEDFDLYKRLSRHGRIAHHDDLLVYESPRRFRRYGYSRVLLEWTMNGLAVMVLGRSMSREWKQVR